MMSKRNEFEEAIAEAAAHTDHNLADAGGWKPIADNQATNSRRPQQKRAQAQAEAAFAAAAAKIGDARLRNHLDKAKSRQKEDTGGIQFLEATDHLLC
jgi:hypothetical protein